MKKYEYVNVKSQGLYNYGFVGYKEIINEYAAKGYKYVGYIPTDMVNGAIIKIDLVFEKDEDNID